MMISNIMKKFNKIIPILIVISILVCGFCSCKSSTIDDPDVPELKYDTQYPQTEAEYNLAVNNNILTFLNCLETHISSGRNLVNGKYVVANEITAAKNSLATMEDIYAKMERVYPPSSMSSKHASVLLQMQEAINSLSVYIEYLEKSDGTISDPTLKSDIEATISIMQSEYTSLTGVFNLN